MSFLYTNSSHFPSQYEGGSHITTHNLSPVLTTGVYVGRLYNKLIDDLVALVEGGEL